MLQKGKIGVIGAGWLGFTLAQRLVEIGYHVFATTTTLQKLPQLKESGINVVLYNNDENPPQWLNELDWCILNFPPRKSADYAAQVDDLVTQLPSNCRIIFTSSTGVYPQEFGTVTEESEINPQHVVAQAEKVIQSSGRDWYILRLAGLVGPNRHPVHFLSGREVSNGQHPVNLIEQKDIIDVIMELMDKIPLSQVFNIAYPEHPSKEIYYVTKAAELGLVPPTFRNGPSSGKKVDGSKITKLTSFNYCHKP